MNLYSTEYLREWHRCGEYANHYINNRRHDIPSGLGNVMVMRILHDRMREHGLPSLDHHLIEWIGTFEGVNTHYPGWRDRAIKLMHDWAAEVYCFTLLVKAAETEGVPASLTYSSEDDAKGVDCRIVLFGAEHAIQIKRAPGRPGNEDDVRKHFRRRARGDVEPEGVIYWRPAFEELDMECQPYVPKFGHALAIFKGLGPQLAMEAA